MKRLEVHRRIFFIATVSVLVLTSLPARAVTLFHIRGDVTDAIGRPLVAASVNDQTQTVPTDATGRYDLPEGSTGTFTLKAWRADTDFSPPRTVPVTIPLDQEVDFTLYYKLSGSLPSNQISTLNGPATRTLTITSHAPSPGLPGETGGKSCVYVTDSRTGATSSAVLTGNSGTASTWTHSLSLSQSTPAGSYVLTTTAKDCSTGVVLNGAPSPTSSYLVDNSLPVIDPYSVAPLDHGNTVFLSQPLVAKITDIGGAGVSPSTIVFSLTDTTTTPNTTVTRQGTSVTYASATGWAKTTPVALTLGHVYRLAITASDRAGNAVSYSQDEPESGGGFLATTVSLATTKASIPSTTCQLSNPNVVLGFKSATCENVPLHLDRSTLTIGGTRHAGIGYVEHKVALSSAEISSSSVGAIPLGAYNSSDPSWGQRNVSVQFVVLDVSPYVQTIGASSVDAALGRLLVTNIPGFWTDATLSMDPVDTQLDPSYSMPGSASCADPSAATRLCSPDPMRIFIGDRWAEQVLSDVVRDSIHESGYDPPVNLPTAVDETRAIWVNYFSVFLPQGNVCSGILQRCVTVNKAHWHALNAQGACTDDSCVGGVQYPDYPAITPAAYASACTGFVQCHSPNSTNTPDPDPGDCLTVNAVDTDCERNNTLVGAGWYDYPIGECIYTTTDCDNGTTRDFHHLNGYAYIGIETTKRNVQHTVCNYPYRSTGPWMCYGWFDQDKGVDGLAAGWPGSWIIPHVGDPNKTYQRFYGGVANQYGANSTGTRYNSNGCFNYSTGAYGLIDDFNMIEWDYTNTRVSGSYPKDDNGASEGVRIQGNKSGDLAVKQAGVWIDGQYQSPEGLWDVASCRWATYGYSIGGDMYQSADAKVDPGQIIATYNHVWKEVTTTWQYSCGGGYPQSVSCSFTPVPSEQGYNWWKNGGRDMEY